MDIFPIALSNRDMQILMLVIEEYAPEVYVPIPGVGNLEDLDEVKRAVAQMGPTEMSRYIGRFKESISESLAYYGHSGEFRSSTPNLEVIEELRALRQAVATLTALKSRIRRPRG